MSTFHLAFRDRIPHQMVRHLMPLTLSKHWHVTNWSCHDYVVDHSHPLNNEDWGAAINKTQPSPVPDASSRKKWNYCTCFVYLMQAHRKESHITNLQVHVTCNLILPSSSAYTPFLLTARTFLIPFDRRLLLLCWKIRISSLFQPHSLVSQRHCLYCFNYPPRPLLSRVGGLISKWISVWKLYFVSKIQPHKPFV
jgi:hypothetical protein